MSSRPQEAEVDALNDHHHRPDRQGPLLAKAIQKYLNTNTTPTQWDVKGGELFLLAVAKGWFMGLDTIFCRSVPIQNANTTLIAGRRCAGLNQERKKRQAI